MMNLKVGSASYHEVNKARFEKQSDALIRQVVKILGLPKGSYDNRYNPAGIACSGDRTLHTDKVYVSFNLDCMNAVLVRTCKGRKDYTGGRNQWFSFERLAETGAQGLAEFIQAVVGEAVVA